MSRMRSTPSEDFNTAVGAQMRAEIAAAGLSVSAAARETGIPRGTLIRYLDGTRDIPITVPYRIAVVTGVPVERIIDRAEERATSDSSVIHLARQSVSDDSDSVLAALDDPDLLAEIEAQQEMP